LRMHSSVRAGLLAAFVAVFLGSIDPGHELARADTLAGELGVAKPAQLHLRVPWAAGKSHYVVPNTYNPFNSYEALFGYHHCNPGAWTQDCYALDVVFDDANEEIFPMFPGTVAYAGCASGGWWSYGKIVYVTTTVTLSDGPHVYSAIYAHLSSIDDQLERGKPVAMNQPIGTVGESYSTRLEDGQLFCDTADPSMGLHLHVAVYRDAGFQISAAGTGPFGGKAVVPEPLIGEDVYDGFDTWLGPLTAADLRIKPNGNMWNWKLEAIPNKNSTSVSPKRDNRGTDYWNSRVFTTDASDKSATGG
jgi:hypothetical protein